MKAREAQVSEVSPYDEMVIARGDLEELRADRREKYQLLLQVEHLQHANLEYGRRIAELESEAKEEMVDLRNRVEALEDRISIAHAALVEDWDSIREAIG